MAYRPEGTKKMTYEEFGEITKEELEKEPEGSTWSQIRQRRPGIHQKFPANQWVRRMEREKGLTRTKKAGKTIWSLKK